MGEKPMTQTPYIARTTSILFDDHQPRDLEPHSGAWARTKCTRALIGESNMREKKKSGRSDGQDRKGTMAYGKGGGDQGRGGPTRSK